MLSHVIVFVVGVLVGGYGGYKYGASVQTKVAAVVSAAKRA